VQHGGSVAASNYRAFSRVSRGSRAQFALASPRAERTAIQEFPIAGLSGAQACLQLANCNEVLLQFFPTTRNARLDMGDSRGSSTPDGYTVRLILRAFLIIREKGGSIH
jgi:hypothetical protein